MSSKRHHVYLGPRLISDPAMAEKKASKTTLLEELKADKTETPLDFFFDNHASTTTAIMRAHQKLLLVHHSQPSFQNNLVLAYNILRQRKNNNGLKGLTGKTYNDLVAMLCRDLNVTEADPLQKKIMCLSHEVVRFPVFRLGVLSTFVYQDFLKQAESLHSELDLTERGKADRHLCEVILNELKQAVSKTTGDPIRLNNVMAEALMKNGASNETMTVDEFVVSAAEILYLISDNASTDLYCASKKDDESSTMEGS
ncbi:Tubulin polyglutamylase complex subunit 1 [Acropora cervicornis]|uniref:Tubulin polyglutamylase complex subunit 1 n=1 Tax=Acropora cervicornis TaxID=6130 RepID=A0AAD9V4N4_ACRCE|nr:Tubulin polyglutamylase complex subunit 1 [Acropora cervicornis]